MNYKRLFNNLINFYKDYVEILMNFKHIPIVCYKARLLFLRLEKTSYLFTVPENRPEMSNNIAILR